MRSKVNAYDVANDISSQLNLLKKDIAGIALYLDSFVSSHHDGISDESLRRVYRQINSASNYIETLYNEYQSLAAETINDKIQLNRIANK